jgi:hypothetical protein
MAESIVPAVSLPPGYQDPALEEHIARQIEEYGTYRATSRIYAGTALAYDVGHPVPISNAVAQGYVLNGQVELVDGKEHPEEIRVALDQQAHQVADDDAENRRIADAAKSTEDTRPVGDQSARKPRTSTEKGTG